MCGPKCNYDEKRLIDANALHKRIEMNLRASNPFTIEECCYKDALNSVDEAPTIDPENMRPVWRDPETDPPKVEIEVLVLVDCGKGYCITTAFYEDGTVSQYESLWQWEDVDDYGIYDEEEDLYRLKKGWWEYRHFTPEDVLECPIDKPVVGWMPLPEKLKKEGVA